MVPVSYSVKELFNIGVKARGIVQPSVELCWKTATLQIRRERGLRAGLQHRLRQSGQIPLLCMHRISNKRNINYLNLLSVNMYDRYNGLESTSQGNRCRPSHQSLNRMNIATVNARSIRNSANHLKYEILHSGIDILTITETWLRDTDQYEAAKLCPHGYDIFRADRTTGIGGGVAIVCRNDFKPTRGKGASYASFEHNIITIVSKLQKCTVAVVYRPPSSSLPVFCEEFTSLLEEIALQDTDLLISGDFNIHWDNQENPQICEFRSILSAFGLEQRVTQPTHIKGHIIDYIITRPTETLKCSEPVVSGLVSDHHLITCTVTMRPPPKQRRTITTRKIKDIDAAKFTEDIESSMLVNFTDESLDSLVEIYNNELTRLIDSHAPAVTKTVTINLKPPWYNDDIAAARRDMRQSERKWMNDKRQDNYETFIRKRLAFKQILNDAESTYYRDVVVNNKHDSRKLFKVLNTIMHRNRHNPMPESNNSTELATNFRDFFMSKIQKIRDSFTDSPDDDPFEFDVEGRSNVTLSRFQHVTIADINKLIGQSSDKSCELDPIPTYLVKQCAPVLAKIICRIINLSMDQACFPNAFKNAVIRPLIKKPTLDCIMKNYRPVSNLSFISKLLEHVVNTQMNHHLDQNNLSEPLQSAYKSHHSTETALVKVFDDILRAIDHPDTAVFLAMLDLSAAFDTVDHSILCKRLERSMDISGNALSWFRSYLDNRTMRVCIDNVYSEPAILNVSVPQGSKLGPRLYSDYTQPLGEIMRRIDLKYHLYADDSQLSTDAFISKTESQNTACEVLRNGIQKIQCWMTANKLKLNPDKTEFMVISSQRNSHKIVVDSLHVGDTQVRRTNCVKNLGVLMDSSLCMKDHIARVCQTCYYYLRWIRRIRNMLDQDVTIRIIQALVLSRLDYCNSLLIGLPQCLIKKLQRVMNLAARIATMAPREVSITRILYELHWLPIAQRIQFKIALMVYKALQGNSPQYICDIIRPYRPSRTLRSSNSQLLDVAKVRTKYGERAFSCAAPKVWNGLPISIRQSPSVILFRKNLKTHLFRQVYVDDS